VEARLAALRQAPRDGPVHLLAVEVSNYHAVTPYLAPAEFQAVMLGLASRLQRDLRERVPLLPVEHDGGAEVYVGLPQPEVLVVLLEDRDGTAARAAVETLSREANYNPVPDRVPYQVECRFGLAIGAADGSTDLLGSSRIALSRAEELGLRYWCFSREDVIRGQRKVRLAQDLDRALDQGSLLLYHQPQLSIANPAAVHSEVLLRWQHRSLGFIDPEELVGIAEQTGLITRLTRWVIDESMRHCALLRQRFGEHCRIAINLSAHDFVGDALLKSLGDGLRQHDLTADCFTLEMTESVRLAVSDATRNTIMQLRQLGFRIAIDDFGTGYAAMSYALNYPVDEIKIDHTFMRDFPDDPRSCKIVASIAGMARELQTTVTVEGVERPLQAHRLTAMACDQLQGYGYARPMPLDAYLSWLDEAAAEARHALLTGNGFH
jgi:EAL domain-containing protein (putative c-di-GMP-specific phosphodiesterase class I)